MCSTGRKEQLTIKPQSALSIFSKYVCLSEISLIISLCLLSTTSTFATEFFYFYFYFFFNNELTFYLSTIVSYSFNTYISHTFITYFLCQLSTFHLQKIFNFQTFDIVRCFIEMFLTFFHFCQIFQIVFVT